MGVDDNMSKRGDRSGIFLAFQVKDIITHEKNGTKSVALYADLKDDEKKRLCSFNLNINNLAQSGAEELAARLGSRLEMDTPIMMELFIPEGALLDDYKEKIKTEQTTLDEAEDDKKEE